MPPPRRLEALPHSLLLMCIAFALIPVWSSFALAWPWETYRAQGLLQACLTAAAYWVAPWLLTLAVLRRSILLIPLLFLQSVGLIYLSLAGAEAATTTATVTVLRCVSLFLTVAIGLMLSSRDVLTPFLARVPRAWRRTPRIASNLFGRLAADDAEAGRRIIVENLSLTGLSLVGGRDDLAAFLTAEPRAAAVVRVALGLETVRIPCQLRWVRRQDDLIKIGVEVEDTELMAGVLGKLRGDKDSALGAATFRLERLWVKSAVKRTAAVVWCLALAGAFGSPACSSRNADTPRGGPAPASSDR